MKAYSISLKKDLMQKLVLFGFFLVIDMIIIAMVQYSLSLEKVSNTAAWMDVRAMVRHLEKDPDSSVTTLSSTKAYRNWESLPQHIKETFGSADKVHVEDETSVMKEINGEEYHISIMSHLLNNGEYVYLVSQYPVEDIEWLIEEFASTVIEQSIWSLICFSAILVLVALWWMRSIGAPFVHLNRWASTLGTPNEEPRPKYRFTELNELAKQLEDAIDRVSRFNERETQFLRHASHELRTPLAIMQASLDTIDEQIPPSRPLKRARYALDNMQSLTQSLLWLARESGQPLEKMDQDLRGCCEQLVEDLGYLRQQKSLSVNVQGESQLDANPDLLKIVLSNLIRNAFQYAEHGEVGIEIAGKSVCISNAANYQGRQSSGFGLGLELVKRICQTQLWGFDFAAKDGMVYVTVEFEKQKVLKA
ncbi:putative Signal transduction histidine kinase [Vibrio nigripulchritudo MADA3029]|uniref:histidine kinase n=3 Tax=Vibrio nigripulchritudo TaxID=28173 RepID=U4KIW2_9VIBR|nr:MULTISPECIES: HAMP domain-containing sensor histidine kinase [Vibrio]KJY78868.1 hypothetical protein TW74_12630 [Vibrio nigripulchritudo]UAB72845.1 HAMP domain-containing histidine kinase [Vibrio sp. SCSIO 43132]CCN35266.1 putative Signal transduction histidine kinase [Vibrio nigripulchritudo AM115]CCN40318.1 putative Signal transduction histidine kinase [Vibrio nigripulchritudo FTn2]CCN46082.1 putative Signal transduction histidine kinase [Vibrio nigripulchritudo MADA3020]